MSLDTFRVVTPGLPAGLGELAGLKSERSQTRTDTIDIVAADPVEQVPAATSIVKTSELTYFEIPGFRSDWRSNRLWTEQERAA